MIIYVYGTTGESIKIATLVEKTPKNKRLLIDTNQQPKLLDKFYSSTSFSRPDIVISNGWKGNDLTKPWQMVVWLFVIWKNYFFGGVRKKIKELQKIEPVLVVVHGDTVTTVMGALFGKFAGAKVAHIEAGLRSGNWKHPFPEEIDRRIVSKIADFNFSPGKLATSNLKSERVKGEIIDTGSNTVADSAKWAKKQKPKNMPKLPSEKFCLVSVHRNEFLVSPVKLKSFLEAIANYSIKMPIVFLDHPITSARMTQLKLDSILNRNNIMRVPKQGYINMMHLIDSANVIVTDSGGLQEESYYLGIPCIVHRVATERDEGIGENVVLTRMDAENLANELRNYKKKLKIKTKREFTPTKKIIDRIYSENFI
jgi:UDP-N-acetylglucosamine 2-epimerase (non-hydrolysing)